MHVGYHRLPQYGHIDQQLRFYGATLSISGAALGGPCEWGRAREVALHDLDRSGRQSGPAQSGNAIHRELSYPQAVPAASQDHSEPKKIEIYESKKPGWVYTELLREKHNGNLSV